MHYQILQVHRAVKEGRQMVGVTQAQLADRLGTAQPAVAALERADANPTIRSLERVAAALGFSLTVRMEPLPDADPVIARYMADVDRASIRENLLRSMEERLRLNDEWTASLDELQRATRAATRSVSRAETRAETPTVDGVRRVRRGRTP
jgi:transcriptional regulator with XRE-family HTH domain